MGPDNIISFFTAPTTIVIFLFLCIIISILHAMEIAGIMHTYSMSRIGKKTTFGGIISAGVHYGIRNFLPKNWLFILFIMVLIPLTNFFSLSFSSLEAVIPGFIKEYIFANKLYRILYQALYLLLLFIEFNCIFSVNYYILGDTSFIAACKKSRKLISGNYLFTLLCICIVSILFFIGVTSVSSVISTALTKLADMLSDSTMSTYSSRLANYTIRINQFIGSIIAPAFNIAALTALFFQYIDEKDLLVTLSRDAFHDHKLSKPQIGILAVILIGLVAYHFYQTPPSFGEEHSRPGIVAHRGDSVNAPENTMPAFEMALLENPDWIELDVFQTKDGVIVVCHDDYLYRVSGKKVYVHDLTYEEIMQLDVGSWFSKEYSDVRISTLDEVLKLYKDEVPVQIEIKYTGYGTNLEEKVLEVINANQMHDQVIITSLNAKPLIRIKELDPDMITTYSMYVAWGHIEDIDFADYYTVEEGNVTAELVNGVHESGGKIFAWTVNSEENVQYLVDCDVDGILTDNPIMMRKALDQAYYSNGIMKYLRYYLNLLQRF